MCRFSPARDEPHSHFNLITRAKNATADSDADGDGGADRGCSNAPMATESSVRQEEAPIASRLAIAAAEAVFAASQGPEARSATGAHRVQELHAEFERRWGAVAAAAAQLDAEQEELAALLEERLRLREVAPLLPSRRHALAH